MKIQTVPRPSRARFAASCRERTTSVRLGPTPSVRSVSYTDGRTKFSKTDGYAAAHYEEILISHGGPGGGSIGGPAPARLHRPPAGGRTGGQAM